VGKQETSGGKSHLFVQHPHGHPIVSPRNFLPKFEIREGDPNLETVVNVTGVVAEIQESGDYMALMEIKIERRVHGSRRGAHRRAGELGIVFPIKLRKDRVNHNDAESRDDGSGVDWAGLSFEVGTFKEVSDFLEGMLRINVCVHQDGIHSEQHSFGRIFSTSQFGCDGSRAGSNIV